MNFVDVRAGVAPSEALAKALEFYMQRLNEYVEVRPIDHGQFKVLRDTCAVVPAVATPRAKHAADATPEGASRMLGNQNSMLFRILVPKGVRLRALLAVFS